MTTNQTPQTLSPFPHPHIVYHHKTAAPPRGVILIFHGLNLAPHCMDPICKAALGWGMESFRVSLSGHGEHHAPPGPKQTPAQARLQASKGVRAASWRQEAIDAYELAHARAQSCQVPLLLAGFSLGGLMAASLLTDTTAQRHRDVHKMVLFAPALQIRPFAQLLKPLRPFGRLVLPSGSPAPYRANWGTSIAAYNALLDLYADFHKAPKSQLNIPTLLLLHPQDEFIPTPPLHKLLQQHQLSQWQIAALTKEPTYPRSPYHLIIDEASMGPGPWQEMLSTIKAFVS